MYVKFKLLPLLRSNSRGLTHHRLQVNASKINCYKHFVIPEFSEKYLQWKSIAIMITLIF